MTIDITFDFRSDTPAGKDPDRYSPTLRSYHRILWSKPLPDGRQLHFTDATPGAYLHHRSADVGDLFLGSDSVMQTFIQWSRMRPIIDQVDPDENEAFMALGYTIGGMLVFPSRRAGRGMTINGARGFKARIADRLDLTVECIRRHYVHDDNTPLGATLRHYEDFFDLFGDFDGYIDFFLLNDLILEGKVQYFMPFDGFGLPGHPTDLATYREFRTRSIEFTDARNRRIAALGL